MAETQIAFVDDEFQGVLARKTKLVRRPIPTHPLFKDLTGQRFHRLYVARYAGYLGKANAYFCRCDCGEKTLVRSDSLTCGIIKSCGCALTDFIRENKTVHGRSHSAEWRVWANMKKRCSNPKVNGYESYGGRGIKVCERWEKSFSDFLSDMGQRPSSKHSIERRNVDGNYEPSNCYWATKSQQAQNTRLTPRITLNGKTQSNWEWACETGIGAPQIAKRLRRGWSVERALTQPMRKR